MEKAYTVDVIIPSYKPGEDFEALLKALKAQRYPVHQIIVMNTEEAYWQKGWEREVPDIQVHHIKKTAFDHGGTRNQGAGFSEADFLLFMTQDALPADGELVGRLVAAFTDERVGAAYARQLPKKDCRELERYTRSFNYPEESRRKGQRDVSALGIKTYFCSNVCAMYRRTVYEELGGFVGHTIFNEDMIFAGGMVQAGYDIVYAADARVVHSHNYGYLEQLRRNFDLAVSQKKHPEVFAGLKSETEGLRLVKQTAKHCLQIHKPWLLVDLFLNSGFKYLGYKLGQSYQRLPKKAILFFTMNRAYWKE